MNGQFLILVADDDKDDCQLLKEALHESRLANAVFFTHDGEQILDYLHHRSPYEDRGKYPMPGLILLDLNMPKKGGQEVLQEIKSDPKLRHIPVVVLTTSEAEEDILKSYELGVNSFVTKPISFSSLVEVVRELGRYWLEIVALPSVHEKRT